MSNFSTKLNLAGLKHSRKLLKGESGQIDCLIIPIKENQLFIGEKVKIISISGNAVIYENDKGKRFPCNIKYLE